MEVIDNKKNLPDRVPYRREKNLYIGTAIVISGLVWMIYNFGLVSETVFHRFFPGRCS